MSVDAHNIRITINDVTLREGDQAPMTSFNSREKQIIALLLAEAGVGNIEVGFGSSRADSQNIRAVRGLFTGLEDAPIIGSLGRATEGDTKASIEALGKGKSRIHIFMAMSDEHINAKFEKQGIDLQQRREWAINAAQKEIQTAVEHKQKNPEAEIEFSPEDATGNALSLGTDGKKYIDFDSEQFDFLIRVIRMAIESGATIINVPDTLGNFLPFETEIFFAEITKRTKDLGEKYTFEFSAHIHNDAASAGQNALAAIRGGATQVEVTIGGIGERTGNTPLHEIIGLIEEHGSRIIPGRQVVFAHPIRTQLIGPLTRLVDGILQDDPILRRPFIGTFSDRDASGVHNAARAVYGETKPKIKYGGLDMEEFFSPRGGATQIQNILSEFDIILDKDDTILQRVTQKACEEAESVRAVFPSRIYALYLEEGSNFSIRSIDIQNKAVHVVISTQSGDIVFSGEGDGDNGVIDGLIDAIKKEFPDITLEVLDMQLVNKPSLKDLCDNFENEISRNNQVLSESTRQAIQNILSGQGEHPTSEQDALVKMRLSVCSRERNIWITGKDTEKAVIESIIYSVLYHIDHVKKFDKSKL